MDYYTILAQHAQIRSELEGSRIETVTISGAYTVFLGFEGGQALKLSSYPDMPYMHVMKARYIPKKNARSWYQKLFSGHTVSGLTVTPGDRVLTFFFDSGTRLVFEMTGRNANIIAVDTGGIIAGSVRRVTGRESGVRKIQSGILYEPPPERSFPDLVWSPPQTLVRRLKAENDTIDRALGTALCAGSRLFALEALARAGIEPSMYAADMDSDEMIHLLKIVSGLAYDIEHGGSGATIIFRKDGIPQNVFPVNMTAESVTGEHNDDLNEAVRRYAHDRETGLERTNLKNFITGALNRRERSIRSTLRKVERERGEDSEPELLDQRGNTVLANLHKIKKGTTTALLDDPYGSGEIEVELDPKLDGPAQAERFFTRARKLRSASDLAEKRCMRLNKDLENIDTERNRIEPVEDIRELRKIAADYQRMQPQKHENVIEEKFPRRFRSAAGLEIIIGRNDKENDELVRWAHKNDLWLHAQNIGGSHVILRTQGKQSPDHRSIELAAAIAAHFSKAKTSSIVPVACTRVKYVVKRKGQGPGKVTYTHEKVLFVKPGIPGEKSQ